MTWAEEKHDDYPVSFCLSFSPVWGGKATRWRWTWMITWTSTVLITTWASGAWPSSTCSTWWATVATARATLSSDSSAGSATGRTRHTRPSNSPRSFSATAPSRSATSSTWATSITTSVSNTTHYNTSSKPVLSRAWAQIQQFCQIDSRLDKKTWS